MAITNNPFPKMIRELCNELEINCTELSDHWVFRLEKSGKVFHIVGNRFDLNTAASGALCDDKVSTYETLKNANLPAVPHYLFYNENFSRHTRPSITFSKQLSTFLSTAIYPLVIKPNHGTCGRDIFFCKDLAAANSATTCLTATDDTFCASPFIDAPHEYRCFFLDNKILLIYRKDRTTSWQHNLSKGAIPKLINPSSSLYEKLSTLALAAGTALNLRFATIDILEAKTGELLVLEANQGVMTTIFASLSPKNYELSKNIYRSALKSLFML